MTDLRTGLLAALLTLAMAGCNTLHLPDLDDLSLANWHELRAERFTLVSDAPRDQLERLAEDLAIYLAVVERLTTTPVARVPARFYIVSDRAWNVLHIPGTAGYMLPQIDGYYSVLGRSSRHALTRDVLLHEFTHFLIRKGRALRYPPWYDEGFAELLGTTRARAGLVTLGAPAPGRLQSLWGLPVIDVSYVFEAERRSRIEHQSHFYAVAWAVTHYLHQSLERRARMDEMVDLQAAGVPWDEAYARAFDEPIEYLSLRVTRHVEGLIRGALPAIEIQESTLEVDRAFEVFEMPASQVALELADLAMRLRRNRTAIALYDLAIAASAAGAERPRALASRGLAFARLAASDRATQSLLNALTLAPDDAVVLTRLGDVHRERAQRAFDREDLEDGANERREARFAYRRATEVDPGDIAAWAGLGWSYVDDSESDPDPGIAALTTARELGAWDARVALDLGRLYRQADNPEAARSVWQDVVRIGSERQAETAQELIGELSDDAIDPSASATAPGGRLCVPPYFATAAGSSKPWGVKVPIREDGRVG